MVMPDGMSGRDSPSSCSRRSPRLKVIFTSGYSAEAGDGPPCSKG